jgi:spore germination protein (amino acid permease)
MNVSPISFIMLFFIVGMVVGAYFGLEAIARYGVIATPLIIAGYLIIIIGVSQYYDFTNLLPILGNGIDAIFIKGSIRISSFSAIIIVFLVPPFIKTHKNFKIVGYSSIAIGAVLLISSSLVYLLVEPYPQASEDILPIYQLARLINYGRFFQRIESLFVLIWASSAFIYLSMGFFFLVYLFKKTFKLEFYKPIILPFAILIFSAGLLPESVMNASELENSLFRKYAWTVTFLMTIILLIVGRTKRCIKYLNYSVYF